MADGRKSIDCIIKKERVKVFLFTAHFSLLHICIINIYVHCIIITCIVRLQLVNNSQMEFFFIDDKGFYRIYRKNKNSISIVK